MATTKMPTTKVTASARERLLTAANDLFYAEGIHTVGIDRVIERAGVAKASLYGTFGSKEELVRAYLEGRAATRQERISKRIARFDNPREQILSIFDLLREIASEPSFRGCAFMNANAEGPKEERNKTKAVCLGTRAWVRGLFTRLAGELGIADAKIVGRRIAILYDGALTGASMEGDASVIEDARTMVEALLDAHAGKGAEKKSRARK